MQALIAIRPEGRVAVGDRHQSKEAGSKEPGAKNSCGAVAFASPCPSLGYAPACSGSGANEGKPMTALIAADARPSMRLASQSTAARPRPSAAANDAAADEALMARLAAGDRQAMNALFARHRLGVYRFLLRLVGNAAAAEDIVSEVFIELWRHAASFQGRARLSTFILTIARNKAISFLRGRMDQPLDDAAAAAIPDDASTLEERLDASQRGAAL